MPLYMDIHNLPGATAKDVAEAHSKDLQTQDRHGVRYLRYWVDEAEGKVFCLVDAPDAEAAASRSPGGSWPRCGRDIPGRRRLLRAS